MADLSELWRPARRDVKGLKEQLARLEPGAAVAAKFEDARYGRYLVEGEVHRSSAGDLTVAGKFLGSERAPSAALLSLSPLDAVPVLSSSARPEPEHGAAIRASFANPGHGAFMITGVAVDAPVLGGAALGAWLLFHGICDGVELLATPGTHDLPVPAPITSIAEGTAEVL